jgi:tetratricopeptide (TPR) repeat protein
MELARRHEDQSDQADAVRRVMEHFRHTAAVAYTLIHSDREPIVPGPRPAGVWLTDLHDHQMAFGWFERERATIPEVIRWLARHQRHLATWQLAWCYGEYLERQGPWTEWVDVLNVALTSSRHTGNRAAEAGTLRRLGGAFAYQSELDLCLGYFQQALALYEVLGDEVGKARVHMNLAYVAERQARPADVLQHSTQALSGYRLAGDQHGQARALNAVGYSYALLGQHRQTLTHCGQALRTLEVLGLRRGLSPTLHSLGFAHHCLGEFPEAITHFEAAIRAAREIGNRAEELLALEHLSTSLESTGQQERAAQVNRAARTIRDALGRKAA